MAELKEGLVGGALNLYFIYKFLRILTTPWESTDAFKLGIVDEKGKILKKHRKLKLDKEKEAYTMMHRLVWKLKRLMEKIPFGKSRLASYAAALWLIKEEKEFHGTDEELQESFLTFLETDWKNNALILKEKYEGDMDKKTFSNLRKEGIDIAKSSMKDVIKDFQSSDAPQFKDKSDKKKKEMAIAAKLSKEGIELDEVSKLPPHLAKFFDKKGNLKPEVAARIAKGREKLNWKDVTPKGYGPKEEVEATRMPMEAPFVLDKKEIEEKIDMDKPGYFGSRHKKIEKDKYNKKRRGQGIKDEVEEGVTGPTRMQVQKAFDKEKGLLRVRINKTEKGLKIKDLKVDAKGTVQSFKEEVEEASTYRDRSRDDEKKKKRHFAFGGKKKSRHGESGYGKGEEIDREFAEAFKEEIELEERKMTDAEMAEREEIVKKMKPKMQSFKDRYGDDAKKVMYATATKQAMEEVELDEHCGVCGEQGIEEKKSATGYELYHKTFSDAMQHAYAHAKSKGFVVDPKEIDDKVATGPKKPSSGKTNRYSLKAGRKKVEIQVANLDNKRYELNMYIEGVEIDEASLGSMLSKKAMPRGPKDNAELMDLGNKLRNEKDKKKRQELIKKIKSLKDVTKVIRMKLLKDFAEDVELDEAEIATSIGSGGTAGLDMGLTYKKKKEDVKKAKALRKQMMDESVQRTTFAGKDVFIVDSETFYNCRLGKKKYGRYEKYVGKGKVGQTIREYGLKYPRRPIILQNGESGPMLFLKYGRS